jgi:histidinol-phosphatase
MPIDAAEPIEARLQWAVEIAREAGDGTLRHFRSLDLQVEQKSDHSPVTAADREAEQLLRKRIAERFPQDAILGEEFGEVAGTSGFQWILDPIDGTRSFVHGVPLYTTLVAVLAADEPKIGVIYAPACHEMAYAAIGSGCWHLNTQPDGATPQPSKVSAVRAFRESLLLTTDVKSFAVGRAEDAIPKYLALQGAARMVRAWGDGYGYLMVATGRAEVMIDPVLNLWDAAALLPVIHEAGGYYGDWKGQCGIRSGEALATNGLVTEEVLAILRS